MSAEMLTFFIYKKFSEGIFMTNLEIFKNEEFCKVRTVLIDKELYFVGKDVAKILGYSNPGKVLLDHVDN